MLAVLGLAIHAVTANGEELNRVWRCAEPLTEDATADRVRWQLDGWLNRRNPNDRPTAPITVLRLHVEVVSAEALQLPLWGGVGEEDRLRAVGHWFGFKGCSGRRRSGAGAQRTAGLQSDHVDAVGR